MFFILSLVPGASMGWLLILLTLFRVTSCAVNSISADQSIRDDETIVSANEMFELGFFSPRNSWDRFLGIWYKKIGSGTVVWVANRQAPIANSTGVLKLTTEGILILSNGTGPAVWSSSNSSGPPKSSPVAQLLDSGNLIVRDGSSDSPENILWQSFDHLSNTLLEGMKFGMNLQTGLNRYLSSWKSPDDPSPGTFTYKLDPSGFPQLILRNGSVVLYRSGPWNGLRFSGFPQLTPNPVYKFGFVFNQSEVYYYFELLNSSSPSRLVLNEKGIAERFAWTDQSRGWILYSSAQTDDCDTYALCGAFGTCNIANSPKCQCLKGFVPKSLNSWQVGDWSRGCFRSTELACPEGKDKFMKHSGIKLPDTRSSWFNRSISLAECKKICLKNCSCTGYATLDIRDGSGCLIWYGELIDIREFNANGQEIYVRMAASEVDDNLGNSGLRRRVEIIVGAAASILLLLGVTYVCIKRKRGENFCGYGRESPNEDLELPLFDFSTIASATNQFSIQNKLGEGGFGAVYKGILKNGQEIAVKRLSETSRQGLIEFTNEVTYIAKLQHRNLVKLLGCCIEVDEKMLVYEFLPNKSLDCFIFDQRQAVLLDWNKRFVIIHGIAIGLLYLHRDSRLRIIHRDLKAENILLDNELNPKISDFGLARTFGGNETEANTRRVMGTYGYMSPEYAIHGLYSVKSDIFSFGVLVLEIVHGRRNRGFSHPDNNLTLLGHAWTLFKKGRPIELIDESIKQTINFSEVLRSIHVALLCVQHNPRDRPDMSSVVMMLGGESSLPEPKPPGFFSDVISLEGNSSGSKHAEISANELTISFVEPR
ncbi:G-type lectin S-receptor-like serine/threonine-protein kinase At4g27290 [Punica granatum]|uniref:Receptor-like serine/threonine-protein kinase n=1 Tax=Punica granatum TaxID=22663 RepID=A0A6P8D9E9_PUNGR|nr:G-type lectin S-receptor-like serine/threonine-protein kinase At4g27290 [Punica granatum]